MHTDVRDRGVKKLCELALIHPDATISGIERDLSSTILAVVYDDALLVSRSIWRVFLGS